MKFPVNDQFWTQVVDFLRANASNEELILSPREFLSYFENTIGYGSTHAYGVDVFNWFVIHKGMLDCFPSAYLVEFKSRNLVPVFANEVFVVFHRDAANINLVPSNHYQSLLDNTHRELRIRNNEAKKKGQSRAIIVTTYNRPWALQRTLPQIVSLGVQALLIDDGSETADAKLNKELATLHGIEYLRLPSNRGVASAISIGVDYWLADPDIEWISYHQDDTENSPDCLDILDKIKDAKERPLLTGRLPPEYTAHGSVEIRGLKCYLLRDCPGQHLYAHREYWSGVIPIPTAYLGAPKKNCGRGGIGAEEDHWITAWSPNSIVKQGRYVTCVPGLVRTFATNPVDSTWGATFKRNDPLL